MNSLCERKTDIDVPSELAKLSITVASEYITMPDGVQIAADIWLPSSVVSGGKVPAMLELTRYWRVIHNKLPRERVLYLTQLGFAHAVVDCRGSGASFGVRPSEQSETEVNDFRHIIQWLASQPWSNGAVATVGSSYSGNTAEFAMVDAPNALKAAVPRFSDFDFYSHLTFPGGLLNKVFLEPWGKGIHAMDNNLIGEDIHAQWKDYKGLEVKAIDGEDGNNDLKKAVGQHKNNVSMEAYIHSVVYRDDYNFTSEFDQSYRPMSLHLMQDNPCLGQIPSYHWASFNDAGTAAGAISRFMGSAAPMRVVIGWWSHGGQLDTNPFRAVNSESSPEFEEQFIHIARYLEGLHDLDDQKLKRLNERCLYYFTAGQDLWKKTDVWPPKSVAMQRWYFSDQGQLTIEAPEVEAGSDLYPVDFSAGTGVYSRWNQMVPEVLYGDRKNRDLNLQVYTSPPLKQDIEITGHPVVYLQVSSSSNDGAVIVYLEVVAPDGSITMLTEGGLRLIHRKVSKKQPPYPMFGPYHSFEKSDAMAMDEFIPDEVAFALLPLSVNILKGHAIRIAIAGHDQDSFTRIPNKGEQIFEIFRNRNINSYIDLPINDDTHGSGVDLANPFY